MSFECKDLERALELDERMAEARAHAETCERCREELALWDELSRVAPELREEWDTPGLWRRIERRLRPRRQVWAWCLAAAAMLVVALLVLRPRPRVESATFLTEEALSDVQRTEAAYVKSIERLSRVAKTSLARSQTPLANAYQQKLALIDEAIAEAQAAAGGNRYNAYVQKQLAMLYRDKQQTLQEWLTHANSTQSPTHP